MIYFESSIDLPLSEHQWIWVQHVNMPSSPDYLLGAVFRDHADAWSVREWEGECKKGRGGRLGWRKSVKEKQTLGSLFLCFSQKRINVLFDLFSFFRHGVPPAAPWRSFLFFIFPKNKSHRFPWIISPPRRQVSPPDCFFAQNFHPLNLHEKFNQISATDIFFLSYFFLFFSFTYSPHPNKHIFSKIHYLAFICPLTKAFTSLTNQTIYLLPTPPVPLLLPQHTLFLFFLFLFTRPEGLWDGKGEMKWGKTE